jgi:hypothetical protein
MKHVYDSKIYQLTFFTPEHSAKTLQNFIQNCAVQGFTYSVTPYGITSVVVKSFQKDSLIKLFERFFRCGKKQETMILDIAECPIFAPYNPTFRCDVSRHIYPKVKKNKQQFHPIEVLHFLNLHQDMEWGFIERALSLPTELGRQVFLPGQVLTRIKKEVYFENLHEIIPFLGKNGYFQYLYRTFTGNTAFCQRYYDEGVKDCDCCVPTCVRDIPSPEWCTVVEPLWMEYEYK